ncbi:type IVB secretion system protein IcmH/DotU [Piscirickettsia salmonis]|uniref:type IVB secretion system protein IcmH/DotU n=1 Tax=Piscirickettsia salmonis TaxID=1238 RepID=UPI0007C89425|nr:hypothetical protein A0O36_00146 [Piscirickettsiaceae bacterium NZ-RLO1]
MSLAAELFNTPESNNSIIISDNLLIQASSSIFSLLFEINYDKKFDIYSLRNRVISNLNIYIEQCNKSSISQEKIKASTYILCCIIDETILLHSWSQKIEWDKASALHFFFNESWGGEKFYKIHQHCLDKIDSFNDILDLIQLAINFGFKGRYGSQTDGDIQLAKINHNLKEKLDKYHPKETNIKTNIINKKPKKTTLIKKTIISSLLFLIIFYIILTVTLYEYSSPTYKLLSTLMH